MKYKDDEFKSSQETFTKKIAGLKDKQTAEVQELNKHLEAKSDMLNKKDREFKDFSNKLSFENDTLKRELEENMKENSELKVQVEELADHKKNAQLNNAHTEEIQKTINDCRAQLETKEDQVQKLVLELANVKRDSEKTLEIEISKNSLLQENLTNSQQKYDDLNKNYKILLENINQTQQNTISQEENENAIKELNINHNNEIVKLKNEFNQTIDKLTTEKNEFKYQLEKKENEHSAKTDELQEKLKISLQKAIQGQNLHVEHSKLQEKHDNLQLDYNTTVQSKDNQIK